ncbi:hypothetical protein NPIL_488191 [Nephila pilipes]|uniref:Uncharacterized protein n=1 Tax=Nephila pilipes TaxID=299642 RepID=A0A8X6P1Y6_NEPPI|nr:hypothetical protein NPIL_488191 [Nephila pilipes]
MCLGFSVVASIRNKSHCHESDIVLRIYSLDKKKNMAPNAISTQTTSGSDLLRMKRLDNDKFWLLSAPNPILLTVHLVIIQKCASSGKTVS